jgi:arylformamidase
MTKWIDITQPLTNDMAHWPGDRPFQYKVAATKEQTGSANVGKITTSVHMGTHVDSPFHFDNDGETIEQIPIETYIGEALVIDVSNYEIITPEVLDNFNIDGVKRLLLHTSLPNNPTFFPEVLPFLEPTIGDYLAGKGVFLLGVDMPSVDSITSKTLDTHHALHRNGIHILENIMLDDVETGEYELIALPLRIVGSDGSPVRAALRSLKEENQHA